MRTTARRYGLAVAVAAVLAAPPLPAAAHDYTAGDIRVEHPWARPTIGPAKTGAAYMTLVNSGTAPDRLVGAASPVAARAEVHTHEMEGGVMRMRAVAAIEIAPGSPTVLKPGGLHLMLFGLEAPLKAGETFPLTLTFERAGRLTVEVLVERSAPPPDHPPGHHPKGS